ncbi:hypothetical protein [Niallia sp. FSL R7-0271]|uniref:hypothetical protein n=1 Tax=Niallia sp. FSL R7-0271 TaxID=2921678 RepID=UPI0030FD1857
MIWIGKFDINEISLLLLTVAAYLFVIFTPKKLSREITCMSILWGITTGILYDFTIGGGLLDLYRENDTNHSELFDLFYYALYGPFGYAFIYFYEVLKIRKKTFAFYVGGWALFGVIAQWLFTLLHIITYQNNYSLPYSFPIFLLTQTITGLFYHYVTTVYPSGDSVQ